MRTIPRATLEAICTSLGIRILREVPYPSMYAAPGEEAVTYVLECPTHDSKVQLLDRLTLWESKYDPRVREIASQLFKVSKARSLATFGPWLVGWTQRHVAFAKEPVETFQDAVLTYRMGLGDCDDHARFVGAVWRALGGAAKLEVLRRPDGVPTHVVCQLAVFGRYEWAETTIGAAFGEHPLAAKARLRTRDRGDLTR